MKARAIALVVIGLLFVWLGISGKKLNIRNLDFGGVIEKVTK